MLSKGNKKTFIKLSLVTAVALYPHISISKKRTRYSLNSVLAREISKGKNKQGV